MVLQKFVNRLKKAKDYLKSVLVSVMNADWSYEKAFYYITVGLVLISWLLTAVNLGSVSLSAGEFIWNGLLLFLTILAVAFFLAHGTRLLIRAIKRDLKKP